MDEETFRELYLEFGKGIYRVYPSKRVVTYSEERNEERNFVEEGLSITDDFNGRNFREVYTRGPNRGKCEEDFLD